MQRQFRVSALSFQLSAFALLLPLIAGCMRSDSSGSRGTQLDSQQSQRVADELFNNAVSVLKENSDNSPRIVISQVIARFDQWLKTKKPLNNWQVDPLVATLPEALRNQAAIKDLAELKFTVEDGERLREAAWLHEIAHNTASKSTDPLARAGALFDWTVRNIQLLEAPTGDKPSGPPHLPWDTLLLGEGTALERAWIFILLARQDGLDAVLLTPGATDATAPKSAGHPLVGVLVGEQLHLFDPQYGLPVPGPGGKGVATLAQAADDASVLAQMDVDDVKYPLRAADLASATAWIEASPLYLAQRMRLVELQLSTEQRMTVSIDASDLASRLSKSPHVSEAKLWLLPFERVLAAQTLDDAGSEMARRELMPFFHLGPDMWQGRTQHLLGRFSGEQSAVHYYQRCRPSDDAIGTLVVDPNLVNKQQMSAVEQELLVKKQVGIIVKQNASYWLGLMAFERGNYDTAIDYFAKRTLAAAPNGPWSEGAQYNLARSYEAQGKKAEAAKTYRETQGPQRAGNTLRAKKLEKS